MDGFSKNHKRLGDRILYALELAIDQEDLDISETLNHALDLAMTRNAGGAGFSERREFSNEIEVALDKLRALKKSV
jgi:hypothetical protein